MKHLLLIIITLTVVACTKVSNTCRQCEITRTLPDCFNIEVDTITVCDPSIQNGQQDTATKIVYLNCH